MRRICSYALGAVCVLAVSTGTAFAAGGGYGGGGANGGSTPAGFSRVIGAYGVTANKGGTVGSGSTHATVPAGSTTRPSLVVVFFSGSASTARKHHTAYLNGKSVLKAFGVGLFTGPTATVTNKPVTITITGSNIKPGDHLAVYSTVTHKFHAVPAKFSNGKVTFTIERGQSVAIFS